MFASGKLGIMFRPRGEMDPRQFQMSLSASIERPRACQQLPVDQSFRCCKTLVRPFCLASSEVSSSSLAIFGAGRKNWAWITRIFHQTGPQLERKAHVYSACGMLRPNPICTVGLRGCWRAICGHFTPALRANRWSREFGLHAARLRNRLRLQAQTCARRELLAWRADANWLATRAPSSRVLVKYPG